MPTFPYSRPKLAVYALQAILQSRVLRSPEGTEMTVYRQWAHPETVGKGNLPLGCVTAVSAEEPELEGVDEFTEAMTGSNVVLQSFGSQVINLAVDFWARTLDERFDIQAQVDALFDVVDDDGALVVNLDDQATCRFERAGYRFMDSEASVGVREWRVSLDMRAQVELVAPEITTGGILVVRFRGEDFTEPMAPNTLGRTTGQQDFYVEPE